ncbi:hypothetical protein BLA29_012144 [Euroglyphus maynei]|uniref:Uncharacterized protein n=1 Tax=Euroglyphus maynei TaxID=6958 RepID=A0A1Y3AKW5_EURMA|nr:hypothetical protein BLA29_012144 [Euroglyphus maynei]
MNDDDESGRQLIIIQSPYDDHNHHMISERFITWESMGIWIPMDETRRGKNPNWRDQINFRLFFHYKIIQC